MNKLIPSIISKVKEESAMDGKYNTNDDANVELKKALRNSPPKKNPNMSEAEYKLKILGLGKKS
jgi:hypothetical protein